MRDTLLFLGVFFACAVEAVEALTIVLAVGVTRGWRSTTQGLLAAVLVLAAVVAALGPALTTIPLHTLRLVIGALLLVFGLQWLRKAILRAAGIKPLHDETEIYAEQSRAAETAPATRRAFVEDWYSFTIAFKGVLLEGLEVAFIVVTVAANQHDLALPVIGAAAAALVVTAVGFAARRPLARVPENALKFGVGVMLTSFGTFWAAEGAGARWPGDDASLLGVIAFTVLVAVGLTRWLRATAPRRSPSLRVLARTAGDDHGQPGLLGERSTSGRP